MPDSSTTFDVIRRSADATAACDAAGAGAGAATHRRVVPAALALLLIGLGGCAGGGGPLASNGRGLPAGYDGPRPSGWNPSSERPAWLRDLEPDHPRERSADDGFRANLG